MALCYEWIILPSGPWNMDNFNWKLMQMGSSWKEIGLTDDLVNFINQISLLWDMEPRVGWEGGWRSEKLENMVA